MTRGGIVALVIAAVPLPAQALDDRIPELQTSPCLYPVIELLNEWGSQFEWRKLDLERPVYGSPTRTTGVWTIVEIDGADVHARRTSAASQLSVSFGAGCRRALAVDEAPAGSQPAGFDDADLDALVKGTRPVIVYAWSPHMPLSVSGLKELRAAAGTSVDVVAVLDPGASRTFAEETAKREGFPRADLEPLVSTDLRLRGMTLHYPASVEIRNGAIGEMQRGYEEAASWKRRFEGAPK